MANPLFSWVPEAGIEPTWAKARWILRTWYPEVLMLYFQLLKLIAFSISAIFLPLITDLLKFKFYT